MLRHLLTLTWKRKSRNLMVSLEILLAFAIVFAIAAVGFRYWQIYNEPLGYDGADAWAVTMMPGEDKDENIPAGVYDQLRRGLLELPEVKAVGFTTFAPYQLRHWTTTYQSPRTHATVETDAMEASDGAGAALGVALREGRWFSDADDGAADKPAIVNRAMAAALFGAGPAVGQRFTSGEFNTTRTFRVVGVIEDFRNQGPLMTPGNFVITRFEPLTTPSRVRAVIVKLAPGTPRGFEAQLNRRLQAVRNDWSYQIEPLPSMRASMMKTLVTPFVVLAIVVVFVLAMVAFGLFGVLWQNTARRIPEIGLRRAVGASAGHIYRQIVAEQMLLSSFAMLAALVLLVQLPLTGAFGEALNWRVFGAAAALSMGVIYLLSLLCSLYPGWQASRLDPRAALHYE